MVIELRVLCCWFSFFIISYTVKRITGIYEKGMEHIHSIMPFRYEKNRGMRYAGL